MEMRNESRQPASSNSGEPLLVKVALSKLWGDYPYHKTLSNPEKKKKTGKKSEKSSVGLILYFHGWRKLSPRRENDQASDAYFSERKVLPQVFQIFWNNQQDFYFEIFNLHIPGEVPIQSDGQGLKKQGVDLSTVVHLDM